MNKTFRPCPVEQVWLLPPSVLELVPEGDPAHLIRDLIREELDLSEILDEYDEEGGYPPFPPAMNFTDKDSKVLKTSDGFCAGV